MTQSQEVKLLFTHLGSKQTLVKLDWIYAWIVKKLIKAWIVEESIPTGDSIKVCSAQLSVKGMPQGWRFGLFVFCLFLKNSSNVSVFAF